MLWAHLQLQLLAKPRLPCTYTYRVKYTVYRVNYGQGDNECPRLHQHAVHATLLVTRVSVNRWANPMKGLTLRAAGEPLHRVSPTVRGLIRNP